MKFLCASFLMLYLFSCSKEGQHYDNRSGEVSLILPVYSETGAGAFGFLMNDSIWTVAGAHFETGGFFPGRWVENKPVTGYGNAGNNIQIFTVYGQLSIVQQDQVKKEYNATLRFVPDPAIPIKDYLLSSSLLEGLNTFYIQERIRDGGADSRLYITKDLHPFTLQLNKLDILHKICSGRFQGTVYDFFSANRDSLVITNGRFDVKYSN